MKIEPNTEVFRRSKKKRKKLAEWVKKVAELTAKSTVLWQKICSLEKLVDDA